MKAMPGRNFFCAGSLALPLKDVKAQRGIAALRCF
jgi:hypothetical protein